MHWKEKIKEFGGGDLSFLSEDGEAIIFMVVGDPVLLEGKFKGKPSEKIGCPVVTSDGFALLITGKRLARKISKHEDEFNDTAFIAIRHGVSNDITTTYELKVLDNEPKTLELIGIAESNDYVIEINEAIVAANEVMKQ